jgi:hypothetical protein
MNPTLDLTREAAPLDIPGLDGIPKVEREAALRNWQARMVSEHVSARVFATLVTKLMAAGAARRHIAAVAAMIGQELDHALLCARVVATLGGEPRVELPDVLTPLPAHEDVSPIEGVLRDVISIGCASETVAVALVGAEREQAGSPALRAVLERILADEVKHARLGWKLVEELAPGLDPRQRARLGAWLVAVFEHQLTFHAPFLAMPEASDRAVSIGAPDGPANWRVFLDTMTEVTIPGLERHGLAARRAWQVALARTLRSSTETADSIAISA